MRKRWSRPAVVSAAGLLLAIVGLVVSNAWGGVDSIQAATSSEEFATLAHEQGNQVRWASWADIVLIDAEMDWTVAAEEFVSKGRNTPFEGAGVTGRVVRTLVGGTTVWSLGRATRVPEPGAPAAT